MLKISKLENFTKKYKFSETFSLEYEKNIYIFTYRKFVS